MLGEQRQRRVSLTLGFPAYEAPTPSGLGGQPHPELGGRQDKPPGSSESSHSLEHVTV